MQQSVDDEDVFVGFADDIFCRMFFHSKDENPKIFFLTREFVTHWSKRREMHPLQVLCAVAGWGIGFPFELIFFALHCVWWYYKSGWRSFVLFQKENSDRI